MPPALRLETITKRFGMATAVQDVSLEVGQGEFVSLLGPSGCGKTTTLRIIAGLETPDVGQVYIGGQRVTEAPAWERSCGLVFQSYALFPHMSVFENIAYGLRIRRWPPERIRRKVTELAELLELLPLLDRKPGQLSGGQQQRVALARALAVEPALLLLDEPLANLDAKLRERLRFELRRIQRTTGVTSIYVTHDQAEAFALSDRIVVMNAGRIEQVGTPHEVFARPRTEFVADFIGSNNMLKGRAVGHDGEQMVVEWRSFRLKVPCPGNGAAPGQPVTLAVVAEDIEVTAFDEPTAASDNSVFGQVVDTVFLGPRCRMVIDVAGQELYADTPSYRLGHATFRPGERVRLILHRLRPVGAD